MLHDFCRLQNTEDLRSQRNFAAEWSRDFLIVSKCKRSRTDRSEASGSAVGIFEVGGNSFSALGGFLNVESVSVIRLISREF